ncbi:MAG: hypothetical protein IPK75_18455 [Acidobacteria bacterium]|nr:hypothetical protein [Acidobacteriota bacterium]
MTKIERNNDFTMREQISTALTDLETDVAALQSNAGYALFVQSPEFDPADSTTYYFGALPIAPATTGAERRLHVPRAGTITRVDVTSYAKTAGSNESVSLYVRKNDTSDTLVATVSTSANLRYFQASGLSIAVAAGDYIEIKLVCPAWGTNPLSVYFAGNVFVK